MRSPLQGDVQAEVCIVGAGYTGLAAALHLAEAGRRVVVLEAARVGWGASGRNGGQIVHSYSRDLDVIERRHGTATAQALGAMAFEGAQVLRGFVERFGIACDLKPGGLFAAVSRTQAAHLPSHQALWERHGHPGLQLLDREHTRALVDSPRFVASLFDPLGGHFHPLKLALGEARAFEALGGVIHEGARVLRIERGERARVITEQGSVSARQVIVACNAYIGDLEPALAAKTMPCGTQIIATEPLADRWQTLLPTDVCVEDCNFLLDYFRFSADKRLLFGGGVDYGASEPRDIESRLRPRLQATFPQLEGVRIDFAWTGNFMLTLSRLPQMGRLAENILYSQGCSGHGVTFTHLAGRLLAESIAGRSERFDAFAALPHLPFPGGRALRAPLTALGAAWYGLRDRLQFW